MIRLAEGVHSWNSFSTEKGLNFNGLLLVCREGAVVVDPPPHAPGDEAFLNKSGLKPALAVVTNKHHLRDVQWWLETFKIPLAMHESEANDYGFEVGKKLRDGEKVLGEIEALHLPGKTPGEIGLHLARDGGTLILGDALIGDPPGSLRLLPKEKIPDRDLLGRSLQRLRRLSFERLLLGDGEPVLSGAKALVVKFLETLEKPALAK